VSFCAPSVECFCSFVTLLSRDRILKNAYESKLSFAFWGYRVTFSNYSADVVQQWSKATVFFVVKHMILIYGDYWRMHESAQSLIVVILKRAKFYVSCSVEQVTNKRR